MTELTLLFGAIVGFSLGLTGGGGAIFAVPLLVYGLQMDLRNAIGISLASVGAMSAVGLLSRLREGGVEWRTGLMFAVAGGLGAPVGTWISPRLPEPILLILFALLMVVVASRMWRLAPSSKMKSNFGEVGTEESPTCSRDDTGKLMLNSRCAMLLALAGFLTGVLSGLFGVGGGFVIVPALVIATSMRMHRAVGTSLLAITLISLAGLSAHILSGQPLAVHVTLLFVGGGIGGMVIGTYLARRLSGLVLQKVFAAAIFCVALFVMYRSVFLS